MANVEKFRDGPWYTQTDFVKDACERRPDHPDYDPTTLYIPPEEWAAIKPGMMSYWKAKCKNFDTIIFFRFGPWFNVYFQDLAICSKYFDLHVPEWQPSTNTGFHEVHVHKHIQILVNAGFKVAICEQTEDTKLMQARVAQETRGMTTEEKKAVSKVTQREVAHIFTKGTHFQLTVDPANLLGGYDTKHVLSYYNEGTQFGYCYFDMSTLKFYLGAFNDDFTLKQFRTLVLQTRPVEFICASNTTD